MSSIHVSPTEGRPHDTSSATGRQCWCNPTAQARPRAGTGETIGYVIVHHAEKPQPGELHGVAEHEVPC